MVGKSPRSRRDDKKNSVADATASRPKTSAQSGSMMTTGPWSTERKERTWLGTRGGYRRWWRGEAAAITPPQRSSQAQLILDCIDADFCDQGLIFQRSSSFTFVSFAPVQIFVIFKTFAPFFVQQNSTTEKKKNGRPNYRGSESTESERNVKWCSASPVSALRKQ